jgi:hypothetical protein
MYNSACEWVKMDPLLLPLSKKEANKPEFIIRFVKNIRPPIKSLLIDNIFFSSPRYKSRTVTIVLVTFATLHSANDRQAAYFTTLVS